MQEKREEEENLVHRLHLQANLASKFSAIESLIGFIKLQNTTHIQHLKPSGLPAAGGGPLFRLPDQFH